MLRLAVLQPTITPDPATNGRAVRALLREAAADGARLAHLPEGMVSGYAVEQHPDWEALDWAAVARELEETAALAAELSLWVVVGSAHPLTPPHRPHNSLYVVDDRGRIVDRYDKRYLSHTEVTRFFAPGDRPVVVEVDGVRVGLATCIEVNFPAVFAEYGDLGADVVLLSAYPVDSIFATKARAHAAIHNYWVSVSVPDQSTDLFCSAVFGPDGSVLAEVAPGRGLAVVDLDPADPALAVALTMARPWRAAARAGAIYDAARVTDPRSEVRTSF